ncbi:Rieske 2Fe-2S domain-containing protein [Amylibacter sp. IMCC11727]|uniref:Rieske 2Fe-2S domain-containing protein n=1 Tax=Amylibacter sp. IMCC11727 TaxID=3039851 RepID=UPI00244DE7D7|nr:Rieske 2Fe-2S domain-containing protein [Amylibacter sp. IMCC11727]WGI23272.1 Rieske 2Fe-2S domain-containing protein [Amylibacter sp. IMCC11727]
MTNVHWHPVLRAKKLRKKPVQVMFEGEKLAVFRTKDGIAAIQDRCPHRSASLSGGRVVGGSIECPYHGWRFDGTGICTHIPLAEGAPSNRRVRAWSAREAHGLIFITHDAQAAGDIRGPVWDDQPKVSRILQSHAHATVADAVENVLDPIHTLFVHKGIIRGGGGPTNRVTLIAGIESGELVLRYSGEEQSNGLLSRLLERQRSYAISRFYRPGVVSLEYWGKNGLNLVTTLYFTREDDTHLRGFAVMTGPRQGGLGWLKAALFVPLMRIVIKQDLKIMADATANWDAAGRPPHAQGPLDLLYPLIQRVLDGETGDVAVQEITLDI